MMSQGQEDSYNIMNLIRPNTVGAEIGVWYGNTSIKFHQRNLKHLYLVDPWSVEPYKNTTEFKWEEYLERYSKITNSNTEQGFMKYYDKVYERVKRRFEHYPNVSIHRQTSDEFFKQCIDKVLDWVYLDGSHAYEVVLSDLENSLRVVKPDGIILGDDYSWSKQRCKRTGALAFRGKTGVTQAVKEFVGKHGLEIKQHGTTQFEIRIPK